MRIALARLLLGRPGLLLLDEPTEPSRSRRAQLARGIPRPTIRTPSSSSAHDRFFLDAVVTRITEIGMRTLTDYVGNYSAYITRARRADGAPAPA